MLYVFLLIWQRKNMENEEINLGPRKTIAKKLAQKLIEDSGIIKAPVSLQQIIEYLQKDYFLDVKGIKLSDETSGMLVTFKDEDKESSAIAFNENHPWCRRRFTIAHEIGHLLMGHTCSNKDVYGEDNFNENESNTFASELLMPKGLLKKDFNEIKKVPELAKFYRVSQQALCIKLGTDGLLKF